MQSAVAERLRRSFIGWLLLNALYFLHFNCLVRAVELAGFALDALAAVLYHNLLIFQAITFHWTDFYAFSAGSALGLVNCYFNHRTASLKDCL